MLKRSLILPIGLGIFVAAAIFGIQAWQGHAQQVDDARAPAFAAYNAEPARRTLELETQNAKQVIETVELERAR